MFYIYSNLLTVNKIFTVSMTFKRKKIINVFLCLLIFLRSISFEWDFLATAIAHLQFPFSRRNLVDVIFGGVSFKSLKGLIGLLDDRIRPKGNEATCLNDGDPF